MDKTPFLPPPAKDFSQAKRLYMEQFGSALVTNTYLKIALLCLSLVVVGLILLNFKTYRTFADFKPLVIRIDDVGRAEAVKYDALEYKPQAPEIKYFLIQFVTRHYGRVRATVRENYSTSLYFLDGRLADATIAANRKTKTIEEFLAGNGEEIEINVRNVSIEDLRSSPYKASVDFEKIYYTAQEHIRTKTELWVAHFVFVVKNRVPNYMVPINPLGLTITYFREDQAFQ